MGRRRKKAYSLSDYIAGITMDEFESSTETNSNDLRRHNLTATLEALWKQKFAESFEGKKYILYKTLDDLVIEAQGGDESALLDIMAIALHLYQPHAMVQKYKIFNGGTTDEDDISQAVMLATFRAVRNFDFEANLFHNFSGYLKSWIKGALKTEQLNSPQIKRSEKKKEAANASKIKLATNQFIVVVSCDVLKYMKLVDNKAVKKTLTIPSWLNDEAKRRGVNFSNVLQEALIRKLNIQ